MRGLFWQLRRRQPNALSFECGCLDCGAHVRMLTAGKPEAQRSTVVMDVIHRPQYRAPNGCGDRARRGYTRAKVDA